MQYHKISDKIHLFVDPKNRPKVELEFVFTRGGAFYETDGDKGRRHLLEHCLVDQTKNLNSQELKTYCFENNINLNAWTSSNALALTAKTHKDNFNKTFDLLFEMFTNPFLAQETLEKERDIVLKEIVDRSGDPGYKLYYDSVKHFFTPESIIINEPLGLVGDVQTTSLDDLKRIYQEAVKDSQLAFLVAGGGIDIDLITQKLKDFNEGVSQNFVKTSETNLLKKTDKYQVLVHDLAHDSAEISIYIPLEITVEDLANRAIFNELFLSFNSGVLYDELREKRRLIYGFGGRFVKKDKALVLEMSCGLDKIEEIVATVEDVLSNFDKYFSQKNFDILKTVLAQKQELLNDNIGEDIRFAYHKWSDFDTIITLEDYLEMIKKANVQDFYKMYKTIGDNLKNLKVLITSKDKKANELGKID